MRGGRAHLRGHLPRPHRLEAVGREVEQGGAFDDEAAPFDARWPHVLPDALAILFWGYARQAVSGDPSIKVYSFATGRATDVVSNAAAPRYARSGHLRFLRDNTLLAAPFDARRLKRIGPAVPFVDDVARAVTHGPHVRITPEGADRIV